MTSDALVASAGSPFQRGAGEFVEAERFGTLAEIRRELGGGEHVAHHTSLREWLDGRVPTPRG